MKYRDMAAEALKKSKTSKGAEKKRQKELYDAYTKNIKTEAIRKTVE
jgi:hypothetical protein